MQSLGDLVERVADAEHGRPSRNRARILRPNGLGEVVGVGLGVVFQNLRRFETVDAAPVAVDQVGEVVDIDAQRDRVALAVDIDVEILREFEIHHVLPRHHGAAALRVFADVLRQVGILVDECPEIVFLVGGRVDDLAVVHQIGERHLVELFAGRDVEKQVCTAVAGDVTHRIGVARVGVTADIAVLERFVVETEVRCAVFLRQTVAYVEENAVGRYVRGVSQFGRVRTVAVERIGVICRSHLVADAVDHVLGARIGVGSHQRETEAPAFRHLSGNRCVISVDIGVVDQVRIDGVFLFGILVSDILALPCLAQGRFARKLNACGVLFDTEFGYGYRVEILVVDSLDIQVNVTRQFQIQRQRGLPRGGHLELLVQNGRLRVGRQILLFVGAAVNVLQHVVDVGVEAGHARIALVERESVLDAVAVAGHRHQPYERQTAVEDARTAAENVFAFAGHIPVETYAGSYCQTCFGHVRGLIAAVVGESLREVLVLVVVDGGVGGYLETDTDRRLEALAEIDLVLQIDRVLHVGELGILLSQRVVVAVGDTERQRFAVVLEIVPCLIDVVAGAALQVAVLGHVVLELQTGDETVLADRIADFVRHDVRADLAQVAVREGVETERRVYGAVALVFFENVYYTDKLIAVHADIDDEAQTVHIPLIFTSVKDKDTDSHMSLAGSDVTLTDTVAYRNLVPGKTYTVSGTLMDQRTGKAVTVNGKAVTSSADFTPDTADGETTVDFHFNTNGLDDTTVVVFEKMFYGKAEIAAHEDINDKGQTIYIPSVKTTAIDDKTATKLTLAEKDIHITDTVAYRNLVPGEKYTVTGTAIDKTTGETLKDDAGKDVTAKASFKAEKANGTVDVEFVFDGSTLAGKTVVMYENIYYNNKLVGVHADISDEAQIIYVPSVKTTATDTKTETKLTYAEKDIKITDTVEYTNLIPGKTYKVTGTAMDKKTGKVIKDADGKAVTSEAEITPETADGKVDVDFIFDGSNLAGKTIVMFEEIRYENRLVGVHADINDEAQTIYVPAIATEALDEVTGIHLSNAGDGVKVKDTVTYKNLIPGLTYRVAGTVMDKDTKKPLQNGGKDITAEAVFTPETADGTVDVEFTFSAKEFAGKTMVLFEKLYLVKNADNADANPDDTQHASESGNTQNKTDNTSNKVEVDNENNNPADNSEVKEVLIAVHEDYSDENQTICVPQIKTTAKDAKSGTSMFYAEKSAKIVDTVSYRNLVPGKKYKVVGTAVDKSNGAPVIANGNNVTAEAEFVAKEATGKVDVVFTFDASLLAGRTIVMFENVYYENNLIATHADITDEAQTLYVPKIGTTAIDGERKDHNSTADSSVTIVDSVAYQNLVQGQTYRVTGKLMDKATGKALVIDGKEVTAVTEFTAAGTEGVVDVTFRFNGKGMTGKQLVVFEQLDVVTADGAYAIASHNDINDAAQTITMIAPPKPKTGDYMSVVMYVLAGIAGVMAVICSFFRKKAVSKKKH